jgi:cell division protein FtsI (penicillin-binding protein 3)
MRHALPDWRARFVLRVLMLLFLAVLGMALYLQVAQQKDLKATGAKFSHHSQILPAFRGMILDRHGNLLAGSLMTRTIVADPALLKRELLLRRLARLFSCEPKQLSLLVSGKKSASLFLETPLSRAAIREVARLKLPGVRLVSAEEARLDPAAFDASAARLLWTEEADFNTLAALLEIAPDTLAAILDKGLARDRRGVELKRQVREARAAEIAGLGFSSLSQSADFRRYYPMGEVSAHLVGFTGADDNGQEGAESVFDRDLSSTPGMWRMIRDRKGQIIEERGLTYAANGQDVRLSLDSRIQYLTFSALSDAVRAHQASAGSAVVLDAETGEILALANLPSYDPNNRKTLFGDKLRNRGIVYSHELGSVMKPFTVAAGLEKGLARPETILDCSPGSFLVAGESVPDHRNFGALSVAEVLQKSSNIGVARIAMQMNRKEMSDMLRSFGFGERPGLGFPSESAGQMRPWNRWRSVDQSRIAYGYGFSASVLQLARAYLAFTRADRRPVPLSMLALEETPKTGAPVFSARTQQEMRAMLESVVSAPGATGWRARVPGYRVGGKTGTAQKLNGRSYDRNRHIASFAGIAPMSRPRLIVVVSIDEPTVGGYGGGDVAAPVFARIATGALRSLGVAPDMPMRLASAETSLAGIAP